MLFAFKNNGDDISGAVAGIVYATSYEQLTEQIEEYCLPERVLVRQMHAGSVVIQVNEDSVSDSAFAGEDAHVECSDNVVSEIRQADGWMSLADHNAIQNAVFKNASVDQKKTDVASDFELDSFILPDGACDIAQGLVN